MQPRGRLRRRLERQLQRSRPEFATFAQWLHAERYDIYVIEQHLRRLAFVAQRTRSGDARLCPLTEEYSAEAGNTADPAVTLSVVSESGGARCAARRVFTAKK